MQIALEVKAISRLSLVQLHVIYYAQYQMLVLTGTRCGEIKRLVMGLDRFQKTPGREPYSLPNENSFAPSPSAGVEARHRVEGLAQFDPVAAVVLDLGRPVGAVELILGKLENVDAGAAQAIGPDRTRLSLGAWSWAGVVGSLGRFGAEVDVIGPPALRRELAATAERYLRAAGSAAAAP